MKTGVKLRACDDRLCEECYEKNEAALRALQVSDNTDKAGVTIPSDDAGRQNSVKPVGADAGRHSRQISHSSSERGVKARSTETPYTENSVKNQTEVKKTAKKQHQLTLSQKTRVVMHVLSQPVMIVV